jgi:hypothetical protein
VKVARAISKANLSYLTSFALHGNVDMTDPVDAILYDLLIESYAEHSSIQVKKDRNLLTEKDDIMESLAGQAISDKNFLNVFGKLKRDAYGGIVNAYGGIVIVTRKYSLYLHNLSVGASNVDDVGRKRDYRVGVNKEVDTISIGTVKLRVTGEAKDDAGGKKEEHEVADPYAENKELNEEDMVMVKSFFTLASDTTSYSNGPNSPYVNGLRFQFKAKDVEYMGEEKMDPAEEPEEVIEPVEEVVVTEPDVKRRRSERKNDCEEYC